MIAASQRASRPSGCRPASAAVGSATWESSFCRRRGDPHGDQPVGADGEQDQRADDRLLPELVDAPAPPARCRSWSAAARRARRPRPCRCRRRPRPRRPRPRRRRSARSRCRRRRRPCRTGPRRARRPGPASAPLTHERGERAAADRDAGQLGGLRARAHRVQLAADAVVAQYDDAGARPRRSAISTSHGMPSTLALPKSRKSGGSSSALICWPPAQK